MVKEYLEPTAVFEAHPLRIKPPLGTLVLFTSALPLYISHASSMNHLLAVVWCTQEEWSVICKNMESKFTWSADLRARTASGEALLGSQGAGEIFGSE